MTSLLNFLKALAQWFLDAVIWLFEAIWNLILSAMAAVLEAIPVPTWLVGADPFSGISPGVAYMLELFQVSQGITMLLSALVVRFLIRRLPFIG